MIWRYETIKARQHEIIEGGIKDELINPASVDICIGRNYIVPDDSDKLLSLGAYTENYPLRIGLDKL